MNTDKRGCFSCISLYSLWFKWLFAVESSFGFDNFPFFALDIRIALYYTSFARCCKFLYEYAFLPLGLTIRAVLLSLLGTTILYRQPFVVVFQ